MMPDSNTPRYKEGNQIQYVETDCYYSPNNTTEFRRISIEPIHQNPFNPSGGRPPSIRYRDLRPRPWTPSFGWTSFIPIVPCYEDGRRSILSVLRHSPPIEHFSDETGRRQGFSLVPNNEWYTLQQNLYTAVCALKHVFRLPVVLPFLPHTLGYTAMYTQRCYLEQSLQESREWFLVWAGLLSYCFYAAQYNPDGIRQKQQHRYPFWRKPLHDAGLSDAWIDEVVYSPITDFGTIPRLGSVILDVYDQPEGSPGVGWFIDGGVPVWYRWGPREIELVAKYPDLADCRPPEHLLASVDVLDAPTPTQSTPPQGQVPTDLNQAVHTLVGGVEPPSGDGTHWDATQQPTPTEGSQGGEVVGEGVPREVPTIKPSAKKEPEWVAFFRNREAQRPALLARETPVQCQRRLSRTRDPPTSSAPVFEWTLDLKSDEDVWIRVPIPAKYRAETLMDYGKAQKRYDPFYNDWDICTEFGEMTQEEEEEMDAFVYDPLVSTLAQGTPQPRVASPLAGPIAVAVPEPTAETPAPLADHDRLTLTVRLQTGPTPTPPPTATLAALDPPPDLFRVDEPSGQEIEEVFTTFYGLAYPIPGTSIPEDHGCNNRRDIFLRLLGQAGAGTPESSKLDFFASKPYLPAQHLINCVFDRQTDFRGVWDLRDDCVQPVRLRARFRMLRRAKFTPGPARSVPAKGDDIFDQVEVCYVLQESKSSVPWKLALISPSIALATCRLPDDHSALDIAMWCAQRGIPFRILYPSETLSLNLSPAPQLRASLPIPVRPFDHKFTREDYNSYIHLRTLLLSQPHMQAALKRGGIVWRLALGTLGVSNVCRPPFPWGGTRHLKLGDSELVDNALTMDELDLICGAYECVSDDGKQRALKSWWPLARYYEKEECGENYGYWTYRQEAWYAKRLEDIEKDDFSTAPLTYTGWKSLQHGPRTVRTFHAVVEKTSLEILTKHAPADL